MFNKIPDKEIKEFDNALLDLINKGLIEVVTMEDGTKGFRLNEKVLNSNG